MPLPNPTNKIGILSPEYWHESREVALVRWTDETVQRYAEINPDFNYFFVEE